MIIAGIGCRRNCPVEDILALVPPHVAALAAPAGKCDEPGLVAAARALCVPLIRVSMDALQAVQPKCLTHSHRAQAAIGVASVAEGCALAAAGPNAKLLGPRHANATTTCALAESAPP